MTRGLTFAAVTALVLVPALLVASCTPAQEAAIPADVGAACVLIRAFSSSAAAAAVCATAEDLAPFVPAILAARGAEVSDGPDASARKLSPPHVSAPLHQIAALPAPRRVSARTCVVWEVDAGSP